MKLKETVTALRKLDKAIEALKKAEYYEVAKDLEITYDLISNDLCEALDMVKEIKEETKGEDDEWWIYWGI